MVTATIRLQYDGATTVPRPALRVCVCVCVCAVQECSVAVRIPATLSNHRHHSRRDDRTSTTSTPRRHSTRLYRSVIIRHHLFTASARGLCFHRRLFVSLFVCKQDCAKNTQLIFVKFGGKVAHGPRKRRLDFEVNPEHVALGLVLRLAL